MTLQQYLDTNGLSIRSLARASGLSHSVIVRYLRHEGKLSRRSAIALSKATENKLTIKDFGYG
jgi:transcriptional regulator with XRE-family HTH domain